MNKDIWANNTAEQLKELFNHINVFDDDKGCVNLTFPIMVPHAQKTMEIFKSLKSMKEQFYEIHN